MKLVRGTIAGALLALAVTGSVAAQGYPSRPVRIVVPFPPGGGADTSTRTIAQKISERIGQPVVIENKAGAAGNVATEYVAHATPDGYTFLMTTSGHAALPHLQTVTWDPLRSFAPVTVFVKYGPVLAVHPSVQAKTLPELIALAKANPGKLTYGSSGSGGPLHLGAELFKKRAGIDILHVPYRGNAPMTVAVVAGEVNMVFDSLTGPLQHIKSGALRAIAMMGSHRNPALPDVPTMSESALPGFVYESWNGILAPAGTPDAAIQRLHQEIVAALALPDVRERLTGLGYEPVSLSPPEFGKLIESDYRRFGEIIRDAGIKAD